MVPQTRPIRVEGDEPPCRGRATRRRPVGHHRPRRADGRHRPQHEEPVMDAFELDDLIARRAAEGRLYLEFLSVPDLSAGIYELPAGGVDPQSPHAEDELYYVI